MYRNIAAIVCGIFLIAVMTLMACAAPAAPQEVVKTVVVTQVVEGKPREVVITATPPPTRDLSKEPITLRFPTWTGNEAQLKLLGDIAAEYKAKNPNVTVKFDTIAFDEYTSKVSIQLAGGDPPDAGWMVETAAAGWIKAGVLEDLSGKLKAYPNYNFDDFSKPALGFWVREPAVYGVPFSTSPFFIMYNADLFKAAGVATPDEMIAKKEWTYENFAKAAKQITEKGPKGTYGYLGIEGGNLYAANLWNVITPFIWGYGGNLWTDDYSTCKLNVPETVKAIELLQQMVVVDKSVVPPGETMSFASGNIGMAMGQLSRIVPLRDAKFKWGIAPTPAGPAGAKPTIWQAAVVVFKQSKNKAAALDFVAFMTMPENITKFAQFWPPARKSVLGTDVMSKNYPMVDPASFKAAVADQIVAGNVVPSHPDFAKVDLTLHPFFDKVWTKDAKVQQLMDDACKAGAAYFKK